MISFHTITHASAIPAAMAPPRHPNSNATSTTGIVFSARTASAFDSVVVRSATVPMKTAIAANTTRLRRADQVMGLQ